MPKSRGCRVAKENRSPSLVWYWAHHDHSLERQREWRKRNAETERQRGRKYWFSHHAKGLDQHRSYEKRLRDLWPSVGKLNSNSPKVIKSEVYVAQTILPLYGFEEVLVVRPHVSDFPVDILAKKDGAICGIDVTFMPSKKFAPKIIPLFKWLGWPLYVCHINADLSIHFLREINSDRCISTVKGSIMELGR